MVIIYYCDGWSDLFASRDYLPLNAWKGQRLSIGGQDEGTWLVLSDFKSRQLLGICCLRYWQGTQSCLQLQATPAGNHGLETYLIGTSGCYRFARPIPFTEVKEQLCFKTFTGAGNMWRRARNCLPAFQNGDIGGVTSRNFKEFIGTIAHSV